MKFAYWAILGIVLLSGCIGNGSTDTTTIEPTPSTVSTIQMTTSSMMVTDPKIQLIVINDKDCISCDTSEILSVTQETLFPTVEVEEVEFSSERGQQLVADFGITALPAYIFDENLADAANFEGVKDAFFKKGGRYIIRPISGNPGKYLDPPGEDDDPVKGDANAPITIIEFSDFECPFCGKFFRETLPLIQKEYIDTGIAKLVYRDFPLSMHENAQKAAEAAECADDQDKFWEYHDKLFENQGTLDVPSLKQYAIDLGLDGSTFDDCLDSDKYADEVKADMDDGTNKGDVGGTPAFFINGIVLVGAQPFAVFKNVIDSELDKGETVASTITYKNVTASGFKTLVDDEETFVLYVHIPEQRHIKGTDAVIAFNQITQSEQKLPDDKNKKIAIYCRSGSMSGSASNDLVGLGYKNVYNLIGGVNAWKAAGYELE